MPAPPVNKRINLSERKCINLSERYSLWCMKPGEIEKKPRNITARQRILRDQIRGLKRKALIDSYRRLKGWNRISKKRRLSVSP